VLCDITTRQGNRTTSTTYLVRRLAADFGVGFEVHTLLEGVVYHVLLPGNGILHPQCECRGWERWHHRHLCRHVALCQQIQAEGKLPAPEQRKAAPCTVEFCDP
jgi:hypothetical protein